MDNELCFICHLPATLSCDVHSTHFCSKEHEKLHVSTESGKCFSYQISVKKGIGRCLEASQDIQAGDIIFWETPGVVAPNAVLSTPQCIICHNQANESDTCETCGFITCLGECFENHSLMCSILNKIDKSAFDNEGLSYQSGLMQIILPIKLLLLRKSDPSTYAALRLLMDHDEDRRFDSEYWNETYPSVMKPLIDVFRDEFSEKEVLEAIGIGEVNSYEIYNPTGGSGFRGIFPVLSLASHSCVPNARPIIEKQRPHVNKMMATRDIEAGSEITINYVCLHLPNRIRQSRLKCNWYFHCNCERCKDETEFGLFIDDVNDGNDIVKFEERKAELDPYDVETYLEFYKECEKRLNDNHYFLNSLRKWIVVLYCRPTVRRPDLVPTQEMLETKILMCRKYLKYLNICEAGFTKNRGKTLYELSDSLMSLYRKRYERNEDFADFLKNVSTLRKDLKEVIRCLRHERCPSFEFTVLQRAQDLLKNIEMVC